MKRTLALLLLAPALVAAVPAAAAPPTCLGQPATVVGAPGKDVRGTSGPDVIVAAGARSVRAGAGDDLVCATGRTAISVVLGAGADQFQGGAGDTAVFAGDEYAPGTASPGPDVDQDVIRTGEGRDWVDSGQEELDNADAIETGAGDDRVTVRGARLADDRALDLGRGTDRLVFWGGRRDDARVDYDNRTGTATTAGGGRVWAWTGVEEFELDGPGSVSFVGSGASERLVGTALVSADMGDGDDTVEHVSLSDRPDLGSVVGGPGSDRLELLGPVDRLDLDRGRLTWSDRPLTVVDAWEDVQVALLAPGTVRVHGSAGPDQVAVSACRVRAHTGRGRDDVRTFIARDDLFSEPLQPVTSTCPYASTLEGGPGADRLSGLGRAGFGDVPRRGCCRDLLVGGRGPDVLIGGAGRDRAQGGPGRDRCVAERTSGCERVSGSR